MHLPVTGSQSPWACAGRWIMPKLLEQNRLWHNWRVGSDINLAVTVWSCLPEIKVAFSRGQKPQVHPTSLANKGLQEGLVCGSWLIPQGSL